MFLQEKRKKFYVKLEKKVEDRRRWWLLVFKN